MTEHQDETDSYVVVFRSKLGKRGIFGKEISWSVHLGDVLSYHNNPNNKKIRNEILSHFGITIPEEYEVHS